MASFKYLNLFLQ